MISKSTLRIFGLAFFLSALAFSATAQDSSSESSPEAAPAPTQIDEAEALVDRIGETNRESVRLIDAVPSATGEDLLIMRAQMSGLVRQQRNDLADLIDLVLEREKSGADVTLIRQKAEQILRRASRRLRSYIQTFQNALAEEAASRSTLAPNELQVFETQRSEDTGRLDRFYVALIELSDQMTSLGLNIDDENEFLERRLTERGQSLLGVLKLTDRQLTEYKQVFKQSPDNPDLQAQVFAAEERSDANKASLLATIHMLKTLGLDYVDLQVHTLELTGEVTPDALEVDVALGLLDRAVLRTKTYLVDHGPKLLMRLFSMIGTLLVFWILAGIARRSTRRVLNRTKISTSVLLKEMVGSMVGRVVFIIGIIIVLSRLGINLGPILAGFGIAGIVIGFALQDTLSNFAAGAMILVYRPYDVGDLVEAAGISGKVRDMNLVSTRILTLDHQTLIVPNSKIWGDVIRNVTFQPQRRVDMVFGISYQDEIPKVERILGEIVGAHEKVLSQPEPMIKVHTLNDSSVDFIVRPWA
ncbi:MAG: mechanosensitive ion channel, partial [Nitrospirae bacterium]|nr:mechanosensitive ion channel [Nitrospirota bacterium]